jgi:peptidoglycan/LPS O-acetylase OafA/YrhL
MVDGSVVVPPRGDQGETAERYKDRLTSKNASAKRQRIWALDFTKGALVLIMVLYHWLNYFVGAQGFYYRFLTFLPPSFICITGFLIAQVYLSRYRIADVKLPKRIAIRGLKLLMIFVVLNAIVSAVVPKAGGGKGISAMLSPAALWSIYVSGNMTGGRLVAFYVLVPISYLLFISAGLLIVSRHYRHAFHTATAVAVAAVTTLELTGQRSGNLELLSIGLVGISIGYISIEKINQISRHLYLVLFLYLAYIAAITVWNTPFPLQVIGVLLTLVLLYLLGTCLRESAWVTKATVLLGKYSLWGYIAQIAILQVLRRTVLPDLGVWGLALSFLLAVSLTMFSVEAVDRMRNRLPIVNRLYSAVFS